MLPQFEGIVTRADISHLAASDGLILDDDDRISILETMRSIDVQACPGSGKTTLIAAKLILLAKKWPFQSQGICVLSHTNVAKEEIISRLKKSNIIEAHRLLSYPHFIGTIQEFINRFLAIPYIHSNFDCNITVDNDEYGKMAKNLLTMAQFGWLRGTMNGLGDQSAQEAFLKGTFRFIENDNVEINISRTPGAWRQGNNLQRAKRALAQLKQYLDERGFFLFRDMYTHAQLLISQNELVGKALISRFPFVFLDEMQDTQKFQDELLCSIFPLDNTKLIVQRFGDPDQAIFNGFGTEESNQSFNEKSRDDMDFVVNKSHRFDNLLANKIKRLSLNEVPLETELSAGVLEQRSVANVRQEGFSHTVIIFNDDTVGNVIEFFAEQVSNKFSTEYKKNKEFSVKVVGAVGAEINQNANDQLRLAHYWPFYDKTKSKTNFKETLLIEAVRYCRQSGFVDWSERYKYLNDCILKLMRRAEKSDQNGRHFTSSTLRDELKTNGKWEAFRHNIYKMLNQTGEIEEQNWDEFCGQLVRSLDIENIPEDAARYLEFTEDPFEEGVEDDGANPEDKRVVALPDNKIEHHDGFNIEISTIHGVKGETHDATLIVETKNHTFDLETMLPYFTGELPSREHPNTELPDKPHSRRAFKPNKIFIRQLYVAMSRPKHMLCFAIHKDRLPDDEIGKLIALNWRVVEIIQ